MIWSAMLIASAIAFPPALNAFWNPYPMFHMPSGSMQPTLLVGEYFVTSTGSYRGRAPTRGDVILYSRPDGEVFVKRIVGLPGERIQMILGALHIDGTPVSRDRMEDFIQAEEDGRTTQIPRSRETLPNGVSYAVLDLQPNGF